MSRNVRSMLALLVLTLFLGGGAAHALPSTEGPSSGRDTGTLVAVWNWLASLLEFESPLLQAFEASGGQTLPEPPGSSTTSSDGGGFIDPNG